MNLFYDFFRQPESEGYDYLAFFRITIGCIAIFDLLSMHGDFRLFFSFDETILPQELAYVYSGTLNYIHPLFEHLKNWGLLQVFYTYAPWIYIISLAFLVLGFFPRFAAILSLILQLVIYKSFDIYNYGFDQFLTCSLFYCILFPVVKRYSLGATLFPKKKVFKYRFNYKRVLQIHLYVAYFFAGLPKLLTGEWWNGKFIWKAFFSVYSENIMIPSVILIGLGIGTVFLEVCYPFLMNIRKTKRITLSLIILMHASIAVFLKLYSFGAIMIALNLTAFYHILSLPSVRMERLKKSFA